MVQTATDTPIGLQTALIRDSNQIVSVKHPFALGHYKFFWIFNCKLYCPMSVALFRYTLYLVKIVENWWCPFEHDRKPDYADARIDSSYWHVKAQRAVLLHPDDAANFLERFDKRFIRWQR